MSYLVANPEDRFSGDEAHIIYAGAIGSREMKASSSALSV